MKAAADAKTRALIVAGIKRLNAAAGKPFSSGCAIGAKWSALYTEIPTAKASGNYEIRPNSMVVHINHDRSGKVTEVTEQSRLEAG